MSIAAVKTTIAENEHESVMVQEVLLGLNLPPIGMHNDVQKNQNNRKDQKDLKNQKVREDQKDRENQKDREDPKNREDQENREIQNNQKNSNDDGNYDGIYVDLTFGRGGHSRAILSRLSAKGRVFAMDKDPSAQAPAIALEHSDSRFKFQAQTFSNLQEFCKFFGIMGQVNGLLMDLGVSSPQLDEGQRGFSFKNSGPLDMRMDPTRGISAAEWINTAQESEIQAVLKEYGEERFYKRIARGIIEARSKKAITTTEELADIVTCANPAWEKHKHPATRCFQAIRIFINRELEELSLCLNQTIPVLAPKGRLVVISFHSLEDRIVKRFIQKNEQDQHPRNLPLQASALHSELHRVGNKQKPSAEEIATNRRARSAVLRVAEKVAENVGEKAGEKVGEGI